MNTKELAQVLRHLHETLAVRKSSLLGKRGLGGDSQQKRAKIQRSGQQRRTIATYTEEATGRVLKKIKETNTSTETEKKLNSSVEVNPVKPELTTFN
jgi:hypothetical protein